MARMNEDGNLPMKDGRTELLDIVKGEVANRILCVGDLKRAARISKYFDDSQGKFSKISNGFSVYTGTFRGVRVSVIGTGMGSAMMDAAVRECRKVTDGKIAMVRFGTCEILNPEIVPGTVICVDSSRMVLRDLSSDAYTSPLPYKLSKSVASDARLTSAVTSALTTTIGKANIAQGTDLTTDSFYDCQGRISSQFADSNEELTEKFSEWEPNAACLQMETFKLLHLAAISKGSILATACAVGIFNRRRPKVLSQSKLTKRELLGGFAILSALSAFPLD